eukprot:1021941-Pelagomonas_calceolata.AAC.14
MQRHMREGPACKNVRFVAWEVWTFEGAANKVYGGKTMCKEHGIGRTKISFASFISEEEATALMRMCFFLHQPWKSDVP